MLAGTFRRFKGKLAHQNPSAHETKVSFRCYIIFKLIMLSVIFRLSPKLLCLPTFKKLVFCLYAKIHVYIVLCT